MIACILGFLLPPCASCNWRGCRGPATSACQRRTWRWAE